MTKLKKYTLIFIALTLMIGAVFLAYVIKEAGRGAGDKRGTPEADISMRVLAPPSWISEVIGQMIKAGSVSENITFTGAASSDDVFGSGKVSKEYFSPPPPEDCFPSCSNWTFLPAAKKDSGWYVYGAGTSASDIIAYLPQMTSKVCSIMQKELGYKSSIPPKQMGAVFDQTKPGVYSVTGNAATIKSEDNSLDGQKSACFDNHVGEGVSSFSYYYVLLAQ